MTITTIHEFAVNVLREIGSLSVEILNWLNSPIPDVLVTSGSEVLWYEFLFGTSLLVILTTKLVFVILDWATPVV